MCRQQSAQCFPHMIETRTEDQTILVCFVSVPGPDITRQQKPASLLHSHHAGSSRKCEGCGQRSERAGPPSGGPVRSIRKNIVLPWAGSGPTDLHYRDGKILGSKAWGLAIDHVLGNFCVRLLDNGWILSAVTQHALLNVKTLFQVLFCASSHLLAKSQFTLDWPRPQVNLIQTSKYFKIQKLFQIILD